jgi:signal recognition particle subunit SRP54
VFDTLSDRLSAVFTSLRGKGRLSDADIDATAREIRIALLEADVALPVVRQFISAVRERARGEEVSRALNPAQQVIKIVDEELITILGGETRRLKFAKTPPTVIMLAGLQGSGKTTLAGKLGLWLSEQGHTPVLVAADLQRPNAVTQLQVVGERAGVPVFAPQPGNGVGDPVRSRGLDRFARRAQHDMVIVDTAGRLGIDAEMMAQAAAIRTRCSRTRSLFVVDAMIGQDAVNTARGVPRRRRLHRRRPHQARRRRAAVAPRCPCATVTGEPIMFAVQRREARGLRRLPPDRMASRILGMGDMLTLIEQAEQHVRRGRGRADGGQAGHGKSSRWRTSSSSCRRSAGWAASPTARDAARMGQMKDADQAGRRSGPGPDRGDHPRHDAGGAGEPEDDQRSRRLRIANGSGVSGQRRQQPRRPVLRGPQDDAADGRCHGSAGRSTEEHQVRQRSQSQEGAVRIRARSHSAKTPAGLPRGLGGMPSGLPGGFGSLGSVPPQLPPGTKMPDLSKLKLPKE